MTRRELLRRMRNKVVGKCDWRRGMGLFGSGMFVYMKRGHLF